MDLTFVTDFFENILADYKDSIEDKAGEWSKTLGKFIGVKIASLIKSTDNTMDDSYLPSIIENLHAGIDEGIEETMV